LGTPSRWCPDIPLVLRSWALRQMPWAVSISVVVFPLQ
jgi:hypothetical protein